MIYIASPYSHPDKSVREQRFRDACHYASVLFQSGELAFSPIAHSHPIAVIGDLHLGFSFWQEFDLKAMGMCDAVHVLMLDGWEESKGVKSEIEHAQSIGLEIHYVS